MACTSSDASIGEGEGDYHAKPNGPDSAPGSFVIHAPPAAAGVTLVASSVQLQSAPSGSGPLENVFDGLPVGRVAFSVSGSSNAISASMQGGAPITSGQKTELTWGGAQMRYKGAPKTLGLSDSSGMSMTGQMKTPTSHAFDFNGTATITVRDTADGTQAVPIAEGEYVFSWGYGDGVVLNAQSGQIKKMDLWDYSQRSVARIVAPASRDLPDACTGGSVAARTGMLRANGSVSYYWRESTIDLSNGASIEVGQNARSLQLAVGQTGATRIELILPCVRGVTTIPLGAQGAGPQDFKLGHLDVDDVEVTMADGTKKKVRGTYRVFDATGTQDILTTYPPTNTGIDLPPGSYKLHVEYPTSAGTTGHYDETFTTPP